MIRDFTIESEFEGIFGLENASMVTEAGISAMQNISRRFQQILPNILTETYSPNRFHFRHTDSGRNSRLAEASSSFRTRT